MRRVMLHMETDPELISLEGEADGVVYKALSALAEDLDIYISVNVLLTGETRIKELNAEFRDKDEVTDVLSFPEYQLEDLFVDYLKNGGEVISDGPYAIVGDIAICVPRAREQAQSLGHSLMREIQFLALHGTLHLLGYDHMNSADEERMTAMQRRVMEQCEHA